jgi:ornithine carbamoyltransferase
MMRHFLNLLPHSPELLRDLIQRSIRLKRERQELSDRPVLAGKVIGMVFEKPSLRTRVSFEAGVAQMGGKTIFIPGQEVQLGVRESLADFARTISRYVDALVLRVFAHETCEEVARHATIPVINGLSDLAHPCQAMADLLTVQEHFGELGSQTVVFVGDGNNVAKSMAVGCGKLGMKFILACPAGYGFDSGFKARYASTVAGPLPTETHDPISAVKHAHIIYTDVWTSMGQEKEREERLKKFAAFQVNDSLLAHAPSHVKILHCLPAHRGEEISADVIEGPASVVFQQAENRMHAQKAVLERLFEI